MKASLIVILLAGFSGCALPQYYPTSGGAYYPAPVVSAPARSGGDLRSILEGCSIVAEDGQMLGVITSNAFDPKSFLNEFGTYGSKFSSTSIWNEFGQYGGQFSAKSPFNEFSNTPPRIISPRGEAIGYLTVNKFKSSGVSPYVLVALLK